MDKLKLELNKQYRDNFGGLVTMVKVVDQNQPKYQDGYRFCDQFDNFYKDDGNWMNHEGEAMPLSPLVALAEDCDELHAITHVDEEFFPMCMSMTDDFLNSPYYQPDSQEPKDIAAAAIVFTMRELIQPGETCADCGEPSGHNGTPKNFKVPAPGDLIVARLRRIMELYLEMRAEGFNQTVMQVNGSFFKEPSKNVLELIFVEDEDNAYFDIDVFDERANDPEVLPIILRQALESIESDHAAMVLKKNNKLH